jgi:hypothetical protein
VRGRIPSEIARLAADGLRPIERVLLLQTSPLLARATGDRLLRLADISREVRLVEGDALFGESDMAAIYGVLSGELVIEARGEPPTTVQAGDSIGVYETLAAVPAGITVRVSKAGTALRIDGRELFDLLADDIDLLQGLFSGLLRAQHVAADVGQPARVAHQDPAFPPV